MLTSVSFHYYVICLNFLLLKTNCVCIFYQGHFRQLTSHNGHEMIDWFNTNNILLKLQYLIESEME